ncbi:hypothetical protein [Streptomyces diastatochromogenes]|uniref:hypothetical protein n=1 Tax=Streptomyces diastatochromogenes TaxID=42236 RepID=UPI00369D7BD8
MSRPIKGQLDCMLHRIAANRADLVAHLRALGHQEQAMSLVRQKGMFSTLPLTPETSPDFRGCRAAQQGGRGEAGAEPGGEGQPRTREAGTDPW